MGAGLLLKGALSRAAAFNASRLAPLRLTARGMAAESGGGGYGSGPYRGLKIPKVAEWHKNVATAYGCILWLWLFWRCKQDGKAFLVI